MRVGGSKVCSKALFALPFSGVRADRGASRPRRAPPPEHRRPGRGRRRSGQPLDARAVERRHGRHPAAPRPRAATMSSASRRWSAAASTTASLPPRDPRLHGPGRRSQGHRRGRLELPDLKAEFNDLPHLRGVGVDGPRRGPDSANSQFFIMFAPTHLDHEYTVIRPGDRRAWTRSTRSRRRAAGPADQDRPRLRAAASAR
jgi:hypothetical protein